MKQYCFQEQPSPDISNCASTSSQSKDGDQQTQGSNTMSENKDVPLRNSIFQCFSNELDLNPARMVREILFYTTVGPFLVSFKLLMYMQVIAEMVGTFILMFCVCGIMASTQLMRGEVGLMEYAATAGLTVIVVVFCIGPISGAHVNPAVTIAFAIFEHFPWSRVPFYVLAQTVGSVLGTFIGKSVYGVKIDLMATRPLQGCVSAFWVELIATFIIMFLAAALTSEARFVGNLSGFVVGVAIGLAVLITGPVSGGSMNPARSLGPAIVSWNFKDVWIYVTAPVIGAAAGAFLHHFLRLQPRPRPRCSSAAAASPDTDLLSHSLVLFRS
ncbi:hypothetical protein Dsin_029533 [Dipteronia sinensis]|uniref:Aquaporin NIP7-1 n=1 Tax=Dipteronia sinensis TaxID=43782 RepID=A0AAE0DWU1_9ROSI|nr:hypothetical protein Dsin_029533 [Dipteronia sinensis]